MKQFFRFLAFVVVGVVVVDIIVRLLFAFTFSHVPQDAELRQRYKYEFGADTTEVLIVGASRAMFCYQPSIIKDSLGMSVYDAGLDGVGVIGQYLAIKKAIDHGFLKVVLYDLGELQMSERWNQGKISNYFPYYWADDNVKEVVDDCKPNAKFLLLSGLYQYNSCWHDIVRTFFQKKVNDNGFEPLPYTGKTWEPSYWDEKDEPFVPDPLAQKYLDKIVEICKQHHVKLIFTMAPGLGSGFKSSSAYLTAYCKKHQLVFWDFTNLPELKNDSRYFKDYNHINEKGVEIFTPIVAHKLKMYLSQ